MCSHGIQFDILKLQKLLQLDFKEVESTLTPRDAMLYALGIGVGDRTNDPRDLQYVYERGLKVFPAQANVICHPGAWMQNPELEIDWVKLLHGEQAFEVRQPLEPGKTYLGRCKITGVIDKGAGKGAQLFFRKELREKGVEDPVCTVTSTYILRGDGGCGGTGSQAPTPHALPQRLPDQTVTLEVSPRAALTYRLSGDYNPIHVDPEIASQAGFERPILHGLCTLGMATRAILQGYCADQPERLQALQLRFSAPVYPGETLATDLWRDGDVVSFCTRVSERGVMVLNHGRAVFRPA